MSSHNTAPLPERHLAIRGAIASEIAIADRIGREYRTGLVEEWDMSKMRESALAIGFLRGRTILQAISYGETYWEAIYGIGLQLGKRPETEHPTVTAGTKLLGQLAILSRPPIRPMDAHWSLPIISDILASKQQLREELGIATSTNTSDFSGLEYDRLVEAIITGEVAIGNPEQQVVQCYHP